MIAVRHTAEEVQSLKDFAAAHQKSERWARMQRQRNTSCWQDWCAGRGTSVEPVAESTVACMVQPEGVTSADDVEVAAPPALIEPADELTAARATLQSLHTIAASTLARAEAAALNPSPQNDSALLTLHRASSRATENYNKQADRVTDLERKAGLLVPIAEVEQLPTVVRSLGDTLREARTHLAASLPPDVVPDFYRAWYRWAHEQWNPAVHRRGEGVTRPARFLDGLLIADPPKLSEWVQQELVMPVETSPNSPGRVTLSRSPYMVEPLDATMNPEVEHLYLVWAAQTGKTTLCELALAGKIEFEPGPLLWALPSDRLAQPFSAGRLQPFIKANKTLAKHIRQDDPAAFNPMDMRLDCMPIYMTGTSSPARLSSRPIPFAIIDEEAKIVQADKKEAHPVDLITERQKAFPRRLTIHASTPNTEESQFWQGYLQSDMRHYFMPCPHCSQEFEFIFTRESLVWEDSEDYDVIERTARYICPHCGAAITDADKMSMMALGHWVPTNPNAHHSRRGYHLNSLYSPFVSFGTFAVTFVQAARDMFAAQRLHNFKNSWEALPFVPYNSRVDDDMVRALCDPSYRRGQLPVDPYYIVVGYDPGETVTHWLACAISEDNHIYVIDWGADILGIKSDPLTGQTGISDHFLQYSIDGHTPFLGFVDSGYAATMVYDECVRARAIGRASLLPTKGASTRIGSWSRAAVRSHPGLDLYSYSDHTAKTELYAESIAKRQGREIHLPANIDRDLIVGLSGQMLVAKPGGLNEWRRMPDDHLGDCLKLCMVSMWVLGRTNPLLASDADVQEAEPSTTASA